MFKKNPNRPPITINLRKVNTGYKVIPNQSFNPFSFKRITRAIFRHDLYNQNSKGGAQVTISGITPNSTIIQPPSHVTIPVSVSWFQFDQIHQIQREAFPQFFLQEDEQGKLFKKTPKLYKFYRNYIINLWRENSKKYLSPSVCRRNLPGDVSSLIRIHAFLQHWGLINFPSKQHTKGYLQAKPYQYCCHICQQTNSSQYYICRVDQQTLFQICNCCYGAQLYPDVLNQLQFRKIIPQIHDELKKKKMNTQQIIKMLQIINNQNLRQKDLWINLVKIFPNYTKQEIINNFLSIPAYHKMNANIFDNNQDYIPDKQPPIEEEQPTVFEDYQNQQQLMIILTYYLYKSQPNKYGYLKEVFEAASQYAKQLSYMENQSCVELLRMMIDFQQSKLELKTMFLQEFQKLTNSEVESFGMVAANMMAEELKNQDIRMDEE